MWLKLFLFTAIITVLSFNLQAQTKWETIQTLTGSSSTSTDDITINHKKWRIVWEANKQYEEVYGGNFIVTLVDSQGEEELLVNALTPQKGETIIRKSGTFYFDISTALTDWVIKIQTPSFK